MFIKYKNLILYHYAVTTTYPAGRYVYPFRVKLPPTLPTSVHDIHGFIEYKTKAVVRTANKRDMKTSEEFQVIKSYDLNQFPALQVNTHFTFKKHTENSLQ